MEPAETLRLDNVGEVTRLREEVARLTRERDAAEAIIGAHRWSRSGTQAELARLRAAIAPTEANAYAIARHMADRNKCVWVVEPFDVEAVLAAINERAKPATAAERFTAFAQNTGGQTK